MENAAACLKLVKMDYLCHIVNISKIVRGVINAKTKEMALPPPG